MNIFILSNCPQKSAEMLCDKHAAGKMAVESAQMLSTAHRILDGKLSHGPSKSGKRIVKKWVHPNLESVLYKAVHTAHPCTVWTMKTSENYLWHYKHFIALCSEYTHRYGKIHASYTLLSKVLRDAPQNITPGKLTPFALAMKSNPECMFPEDPVRSYREFYKTKQNRFKMVWTSRSVPDWWTE